MIQICKKKRYLRFDKEKSTLIRERESTIGTERERKGERESPPTYTVSNPGTMVIESLYTVITDRAVRRSKIKLFVKNRHIFKQIVCQLWWEPLCPNYMYWVSQKSQVKKECRDFWLTQYQFWIHWTLFWNQLHEITFKAWASEQKWFVVDPKTRILFVYLGGRNILQVKQYLSFIGCPFT